MKRAQASYILKDLKKKMVFLIGPRQVGKTWLARRIAEEYRKPMYLNYDRLEDKELIKKEAWPETTDLLIFDEIHKMPEWKNFVKGIYDTKPQTLHLLVTGSARLETFRQAGDSMSGRYYRHRLFPFSYKELPDKKPDSIDRLIMRGGFPEPFTADDDVDADRWRQQYIDGLVRTDVLDFERIHDLRTMQTIVELLQRRVGSPVSYNSIAEDVQASPNTIMRYIEILEALFIVFRITPYSRNIARSLLKEPKIYFYDSGMVIGDDGARFENMVAVCLYKHVCGLSDFLGKQADLKYIRTKDGVEVDFCIVEKDRPLQIVEAKAGGRDFGTSLKNIHEKYRIPAVAVIKNLKREYKENGIPVIPASQFLNDLFL
jgi:uncharacterized protein